ncbi:MBL fold metallo-hydrolase (plasmid) [Bacillus sp. S3]|uniref:MBL fold metallo-hydrolase n=1 Tax=Bacillus sp. S3 TaxID=486398 RepID=UPI0011886AFE|nr:MBL fold metallo-hydrolase [Bacillus sp. S3]QCJ45428.1 MBL fold metallo-hydrolase [Bacillus sp. S3]
MNQFQVFMFEAGNGDCFLIKCVGESITNVLVDFGYSNTYKKHVKNHFSKMDANNEKLDLIIVTHIDQDHISGGIRFFEENGVASSPNIINVGEVWHNSYRHLEMVETDKKLTEKERLHINRNSIVVEKNRTSNPTDTSGKQGSRLAANLYHYGYKWNYSFNNHAISFKGEEPIWINDSVKVTVLGPTLGELENLKKIWKKELKIKFPTIELNGDVIFDDAIECISLMKRPNNLFSSVKDTSIVNNPEKLAKTIFQEDQDEINASSITCVIEFMNKRILLLGDSISSHVEAQLKKIYKETELPIIFDAIKVSHHGSARNTRNELLNIIDSEHYFISTNGSIHGHPDIETIAKIIVRPYRGFTRNLYFTNKISEIEVFENEEWQKKYEFRTHYRNLSEDFLQINL